MMGLLTTANFCNWPSGIGSSSTKEEDRASEAGATGTCESQVSKAAIWRSKDWNVSTSMAGRSFRGAEIVQKEDWANVWTAKHASTPAMAVRKS